MNQVAEFKEYSIGNLPQLSKEALPNIPGNDLDSQISTLLKIKIQWTASNRNTSDVTAMRGSQKYGFYHNLLNASSNMDMRDSTSSTGSTSRKSDKSVGEEEERKAPTIISEEEMLLPVLCKHGYSNIDS